MSHFFEIPDIISVQKLLYIEKNFLQKMVLKIEEKKKNSVLKLLDWLCNAQFELLGTQNSEFAHAWRKRTLFCLELTKPVEIDKNIKAIIGFGIVKTTKADGFCYLVWKKFKSGFLRTKRFSNRNFDPFV